MKLFNGEDYLKRRFEIGDLKWMEESATAKNPELGI